MLDKVHVSGLPGFKYVVDVLTTCTLIAIVFNFMDIFKINSYIMRPTGSEKIGYEIAYSSFIFYVQYSMYYYSFVIALVSYYDLSKEQCFHCKWGFFIIQPISLLILMSCVMEYVPWITILLSVGLIVAVACSRIKSPKKKDRVI